MSHEKAPREVGIDVFDYPHVFVLPKPVTVDGLPRQVAIGDRTRPTLFHPRKNKDDKDRVTNLASWTDDTSMRGCHAISLLLKDGRVLIGGGRTYSGIREDANAQGQEGSYRIGCEHMGTKGP